MAVVVSITLQVLIVRLDWAAPIFHTSKLSLEDWRAVAWFSLIPVALVELRKVFLRRRMRA
jgi:hypothetical protein